MTLGCAAFYLLWEFEVIERFLIWLEGLPPIAGLAVFMPAFFLVSLPTGYGPRYGSCICRCFGVC